MTVRAFARLHAGADRPRFRPSIPTFHMFSCACSLRSTQCAALIALAAAAGLSRFAPASTQGTANEPAATAAASATLRATKRASDWWSAASLTLAPTTGMKTEICGRPISSSTVPTLFPPEMRVPVASAATSPVGVFPRSVAPSTARNHFHPYAAGPPPRGIHPNLSVRALRVPDPGPRSAGSDVSPGSALCGEPGFLLP